MTRHGFLWRAHYAQTTLPGGPYGYRKFVRAWTPLGALRLARVFKHQGWTVSVERYPEHNV